MYIFNQNFASFFQSILFSDSFLSVCFFNIEVKNSNKKYTVKNTIWYPIISEIFNPHMIKKPKNKRTKKYGIEDIIKNKNINLKIAWR